VGGFRQTRDGAKQAKSDGPLLFAIVVDARGRQPDRLHRPVERLDLSSQPTVFDRVSSRQGAEILLERASAKDCRRAGWSWRRAGSA
jgi:hypothetical protein